jgi:hypothetical protein
MPVMALSETRPRSSGTDSYLSGLVLTSVIVTDRQLPVPRLEVNLALIGSSALGTGCKTATIAW